MPKILFVNHTSSLGGPSYSLLKLLKYLHQDYQLAVVAPGNGELFEKLEKMGVLGYRADSSGLTARSIPWLFRLVRNGDFDLVYGNNYSSGPRNALVAAKLCGKPFIWHIREMLRDTHWKTSAFLRFADAIIAVSQASTRLLKSRLPDKEVSVIYNGVDPEEFQLETIKARKHAHKILDIPEERPVIISVGKVGERKGQKFVLEAAARVVRDHPKAFFAIVGGLDRKSDYFNSLENIIDQKGLDNNVRFLGFRNDVPEFLIGSDIFLHTALWDPNPRVVIEAMAARLPVVAFDVDGVPEMVTPGKTGNLVPTGDVEGLSDSLKKLLDNPTLRERMGRRGEERVQTLFTAEETAKQVNVIIDDLLGA